jgi:nicotinate phosphoribosyltransferase
MASADLLAVYDEVIDTSAPLEIFNPEETWKRKTFTEYTLRELQVPIFKGGECVYESPSVKEIREYCLAEVATLWDEVRRFENPHRYYVDLTRRLWDIKREMLERRGAKA